MPVCRSSLELKKIKYRHIITMIISSTTSKNAINENTECYLVVLQLWQSGCMKCQHTVTCFIMLYRLACIIGSDIYLSRSALSAHNINYIDLICSSNFLFKFFCFVTFLSIFEFLSCFPVHSRYFRLDESSECLFWDMFYDFTYASTKIVFSYVDTTKTH